MKKGTRTTLIVLGVIALVFIFFAFFTETEIRIEINSKESTPEYSSNEECYIREIQKCPEMTDCAYAAEAYCNTLGLPETE